MRLSHIPVGYLAKSRLNASLTIFFQNGPATGYRQETLQSRCTLRSPALAVDVQAQIGELSMTIKNTAVPEMASTARSATQGGLLADLASFMREWIRNPRSVAAIAPSGRALASLITKEISAATGPVIELGSGTGAFTRTLLKRGVAEDDLTLIEYGSDFVRLLQRRFPNSRVLWMDASWLSRAELFKDAPVGAVICGLGLLNMKEEKIAEILRGAFRYLRQDGAFYLFTYGPRCSVSPAIISELSLDVRYMGTTIKNIPPASVYRLSRRGTGSI